MASDIKEYTLRTVALHYLIGNRSESMRRFKELSELDRLEFCLHYMTDECQEDEQISALQLLSRYIRERKENQC